jgi:2-methyl-3-hydroxypyridine 5-carboxylic acid dioxygenase
VNAVELAHALDQNHNLADALGTWEERRRPVTDAAQARGAYLAETRAMAQGNGFTPAVMEIANFELSATGPETLAVTP